MLAWLEKHNNVSWTITILIAIFIFYISTLTARDIPGPVTSNLKAVLYHIIIFFLLSSFLLISTIKGKNPKFLIPTIILASLYAISDEFHQLFTTGRASTLSDIFLNTLGILLASTIYSITILFRKSNGSDRIPAGP